MFLLVGGKDSTVLLDLARRIYPDIETVFIDTGLEYPEIKNFIKSKENVTIIRPELSFRQIINKYGYPVISKEISKLIYGARHGKNEDKRNNYKMRLDGFNVDGTYSEFKQSFKKYKYLLEAPFEISNRCCLQMKENPARKYEREINKKAIIGTMACESKNRKDGWLKTGCNAFESNVNISKPMSFWTEQDVLKYLKLTGIPYASVYGDIIEEWTNYKRKKNVPTGKLKTTDCQRTGCVFCVFGYHLEKEPNRFQRLKQTHPKLWEYCMKSWDEGGLGMKEVLNHIGVKYE